LSSPPTSSPQPWKDSRPRRTASALRIAEIRQMLGGGRLPQADNTKPKRRVSAAARRRMAKAQRLRWRKIKQGGRTAASWVAPGNRVSSSNSDTRDKRERSSGRLRAGTVKMPPSGGSSPKTPKHKVGLSRIARG